jgi:hypothetical protein
MTGALRIALALSVALWLGGGCAGRQAVRHPETTSQISFSPGDLRFTRIAEGEDCVTRVLGIQLSSPSYQEAARRALTSAAAEHLLNQVSSEGIERGFYIPNPFSRHASGRLFVFYGQHCVYVEGHGISRSQREHPLTLP